MASDKKKKGKGKGGTMTKPLIAVFVVGLIGLVIRFYMKYETMPYNHLTEFLQVWKWVL